MALTETEKLYNLALGLISNAEVESGGTDKQEYILCQRFYPSARDEVLASHKWNEAKKPIIIMQDTVKRLFGYKYRYAKPSDCLRVLSINEDVKHWEVENEYIITNHILPPPNYDANSVDYVAGQYISYENITYLVDASFTSSDWDTDSDAYLTSQEDDYGIINVEYIFQLTDITKFLPKLKNAIAEKLAIKIITALTNDPKNKEALQDYFDKKTMPQARSVDAQEGRMKPFFSSSWIRSRR